MTLGGDSKARKTWLLMYLAFSIATGKDWLGIKTHKGRVLYVNCELQEQFFKKRGQSIKRAMDVEVLVPNLVTWTTRGHFLTAEAFKESVLERIGEEKFDVIIIDPLYKLLNGADANSAGEMQKILSELEQIAERAGAGLVYGDHFAKGNSAGKKAVDRISGSGVTAQDPDAILTVTMDCTDDRVHGLQAGRHFHGYYYDFCFLPLYVFCGERLLVSYLRESNIDSAKHAWAILALLVKALRQRWPELKITVRADSGFCRWKMLRWCERAGVNYIVGLAKNERLHALSAKLQKRAERKYQRSGEKVRLFTQFKYKAQSWDRKRRVIAKAEHSIKGANRRYVLTNLEGRAQALYDEIYCARGEMENRIKEQQLGLFSDRTSCHAWWANQFRLLLSSLAYEESK